MNKNLSIDEIIKGRRSVFPPMYTGEKVSDEMISQILENAIWAPTHKKTEPWRFYVISGGFKNKFRDFAEAYYLEHNKDAQYSSIKHKKIKFNLDKASHIIAIILHRDDQESVPEWEEIAAVSMAVQNMWLTAHSLGIGAYWSTPDYALNSGELVGLEKNQRCLGWFYLGVPQENISIKSDRGELDEVVTWLD